MDLFPKIIGQESAKKRLSFSLEGFAQSKIFPPTLLNAPRGFGKTGLMRSVSARIARPYLEINGASLKNVTEFVERCITPHLGTEVTIGIDEVHAAAPAALEFLLSVTGVNWQTNQSIVSHAGNNIEIDWTKQTFIFATTNAEALSEALKSRCDVIDFEVYKPNELVQILRNQFNTKFQDDVEAEIVSCCRNTPREVTKLAQKINQYCSIKGRLKFDHNDWQELKNRLNIKPLGLTELELQVLRELKNEGLTLTQLAAKLRMDRTAVQKNLERFLLEMGLIKIDVKRYLTLEGARLIKGL